MDDVSLMARRWSHDNGFSGYGTESSCWESPDIRIYSCHPSPLTDDLFTTGGNIGILLGFFY